MGKQAYETLCDELHKIKKAIKGCHTLGELGLKEAEYATIKTDDPLVTEHTNEHESARTKLAKYKKEIPELIQKRTEEIQAKEAKKSETHLRRTKSNGFTGLLETLHITHPHHEESKTETPVEEPIAETSTKESKEPIKKSKSHQRIQSAEIASTSIVSDETPTKKVSKDSKLKTEPAETAVETKKPHKTVIERVEEDFHKHRQKHDQPVVVTEEHQHTQTTVIHTEPVVVVKEHHQTQNTVPHTEPVIVAEEPQQTTPTHTKPVVVVEEHHQTQNTVPHTEPVIVAEEPQQTTPTHTKPVVVVEEHHQTQNTVPHTEPVIVAEEPQQTTPTHTKPVVVVEEHHQTLNTVIHTEPVILAEEHQHPNTTVTHTETEVVVEEHHQTQNTVPHTEPVIVAEEPQQTTPTHTKPVVVVEEHHQTLNTVIHTEPVILAEEHQHPNTTVTHTETEVVVEEHQQSHTAVTYTEPGVVVEENQQQTLVTHTEPLAIHTTESNAHHHTGDIIGQIKEALHEVTHTHHHEKPPVPQDNPPVNTRTPSGPTPTPNPTPVVTQEPKPAAETIPVIVKPIHRTEPNVSTKPNTVPIATHHHHIKPQSALDKTEETKAKVSEQRERQLSQFILILNQLKAKRDKFHADYPNDSALDINKPYGAVCQLLNTLNTNIENYKNQTIPTLKEFKNMSSQAIKEKRQGVLSEHRGWKEILHNLLLALGTLGIGYAVGALFTKSWTPLKPPTDTVEILDETANTLNRVR